MLIISNQHKQTALDVLKGNWKTAILTGFVASLIGGTVVSPSNSGIRYEEKISNEELNILLSSELKSALILLLVVIGILSIVSLFLGGAAKMGYAQYNLNLLDNKTAVFHDLFSHMNRKWKGFCMNFFISLYTGLWSLLLVIPGIVKSYAYAMTPYILAENPEITANQAISESEYIMTGHKWDLFCLHLSFLGWQLLVAIPMIAILIPAIFNNAGILELFRRFLICIPLSFGDLFLRPYMEASQAAFYRSIVPIKNVSTEEFIVYATES